MSSLKFLLNDPCAPSDKSQEPEPPLGSPGGEPDPFDFVFQDPDGNKVKEDGRVCDHQHCRASQCLLPSVIIPRAEPMVITSQRGTPYQGPRRCEHLARVWKRVSGIDLIPIFRACQFVISRREDKMVASGVIRSNVKVDSSVGVLPTVESRSLSNGACGVALLLCAIRTYQQYGVKPMVERKLLLYRRTVRQPSLDADYAPSVFQAIILIRDDIDALCQDPKGKESLIALSKQHNNSALEGLATINDLLARWLVMRALDAVAAYATGSK